jgi:hypothetical protein
VPARCHQTPALGPGCIVSDTGALGLELVALPRGALDAHETRLARERERARRLDAPAEEAAALVRQARARVDRWERERLCSEHYIARWRALLVGPVRRVARALLAYDAWTDALLQSSPWGFALEPPAA